MKEAAGEANMTVITIVLIAVVLAAGTIIVTNMMRRTGENADNNANQQGYTQTTCTKAGGTWNGNKCNF